MGKALNGLLLVGAIWFALALGMGMSPPLGALWELLSGSFNWNTFSAIQLVLDLVLSLGGAAIIVGTLISGNIDFAIFATFATLFLSFGMGILELYQRAVSTGNSFIAGIVLLITGPLAVMYFYYVLKFWRGND